MKANELKTLEQVDELQIKYYLPMEEKKLIAKGIIYECTEHDNGVIKVDSVQKELSYIKYMILRHTDLEYAPENYDALCSTGMLNVILDKFAEDAKECRRILDLMMGDYLQESSIEFTVAKFLNGLSSLLGEVTGKLGDKIDSINWSDFIPQDVDVKKLTTFLNNYIK